MNIWTQNEDGSVCAKFSDLKKLKLSSDNAKDNWKFNDENGQFDILLIDNSFGPSIEFVPVNKNKEIKSTNRSYTRVSGLNDGIQVVDFIKDCNRILNEYRNDTLDVFLTSFKGLRKDGYYRRRLDFGTAKAIMNKVLNKYKI